MTWAPDYCSLGDVKDYLRIADTDDDVMLAAWITTASRAVDQFCGRQFGAVASAETREYRGQYDRLLGMWVVQIDDLFDDDITVIDSYAVERTDYELGPANAPKKGRPYERLITSAGGMLTIDAVWGWPAVPPAVKTATMLQVARLAKRRDSPFGISGSPQEQGEVRLLAQLDVDLMTSLQSYRRKWWAG